MKIDRAICVRLRGLVASRFVAHFLTPILLAALAVAPGSAATINHYGGTYADWPASWTALIGLNDSEGASYLQLDFVGDADDPAAYWGSNGTYVFFRMRTAFDGPVSTGNPPTFADSIFLYIDRVGWGNGNGVPDYALAWDSKAQNHGLEMLLPPATPPAAWSGILMQDLDGNVGQKVIPPDINRTGDGYIRTIDGVTTARLGLTTYVDFAVRWDYLQAHTALQPGQPWRIALGSVHDQTDHAGPATDIAGGALPSSALTTGWSESFGGDASPVPEPRAAAPLVFGAASTLVARFAKRRRRG